MGFSLQPFFNLDNKNCLEDEFTCLALSRLCHILMTTWLGVDCIGSCLPFPSLGNHLGIAWESS